MSWENDFETLCDIANEQLSSELENKAMAAVNEAVAAGGKGLTPAATHAITVISTETSWGLLIEILKKHPWAFVRDADATFYKKCPENVLANFIGGDKGVFSQMIERLGDPGRDWKLDNTDIRMMHVVVDGLLALGHKDKLKKVAEVLFRICQTRFIDDMGRPALIPSQVYSKLLAHNIVQPKGQGQQSAPARPVRYIAEESRRDIRIDSQARAAAERAAGTPEQRANHALRGLAAFVPSTPAN